MGKQEADWKQQRWHVLDWAAVGVAGAVIFVYLARWSIAGQDEYLGFALFFFAWVLLFFTRLWQPILYLLMTVLVFASIIFSFLGSNWEQPLGLTAILLRGAFIFIIIPLFFIEERGQ